MNHPRCRLSFGLEFEGLLDMPDQRVQVCGLDVVGSLLSNERLDLFSGETFGESALDDRANSLNSLIVAVCHSTIIPWLRDLIFKSGLMPSVCGGVKRG